MALNAWNAISKRRRETAALHELAVANLTCLTANMNRDSSKAPKPFELRDFLLLRDRENDGRVFDADVAAVALALRHEDRCPPLLLSVWPQILEAASKDAVPPKVRALHSDDGFIWVLAPRWEGHNVRGGLVAVQGRYQSSVVLRDLDRPLLTYRLQLPEHSGYGWLEARALLVAAES